MVTVLGHRGYLGAVVERRWRELGVGGDYVVNCLFPDDIDLIGRLAGPGVILVSSDAIAEDGTYAAGKRAVELYADEATVIRAGVVDIRKRHDVAYTTWLCNPLTPLEWADLAYEVRDKPGLHVAGRGSLTRYDVASAVASVFGGPLPQPKAVYPGRTRCQVPDRPRPSLTDALVEFREWLEGV